MFVCVLTLEVIYHNLGAGVKGEILRFRQKIGQTLNYAFPHPNPRPEDEGVLIPLSPGEGTPFGAHSSVHPQGCPQGWVRVLPRMAEF